MAGDGAWFLMFLLGCLALAWSPWPGGAKNLNYTAAIAVSYGLFLFVVRGLMLLPELRWEDISRAASMGLTILALAVVAEFVMASFYGVFFSDIIPYAHRDLTVANFIDERFRRPRAFATEPGFTSLAFECLWPLTWLDRRPGHWFRQALFGTAFLLLGSAAGMGSLLFAVGLWWVLKSRDWKRSLIFVGAIAVVVVPVSLTDSGADALWSLFGRKFDIFTPEAAAEGAEGVTVLDRIATWAVGVDLIQTQPLGIGWGSLAQLYADELYLPATGTLNGSGMLSLPLDVTVAAGLPGLLAFAWFFGLRWRRVLTMQSSQARCVGIALMSVTVHHLFITEFQFPFMWFAIALADRLAFDAEHAFEARHAVPPSGSDKLAPLS
jgi:hypothetical protein